MDFTDLIMNGATREDVQKLLDDAVPYVKAEAVRVKPPAFDVNSIIDLADVQEPEDTPLMFGEYLLPGCAHWLTAQTGMGKSTWAYNVACALAEGTSLWGIDCEPQKILYLDMESGNRIRAKKIRRLYNDAERKRGSLKFYTTPIHLREALPEMLSYCKANQITLVIFDTVRRCFSVENENDNAEVYNKVIPVLDALKAEGIATLTMGHPAKNGGMGARGAGAQEDAGDINMTLTLHKGEINDKDCIVVLKVTKNRELGHVPPLYLKRIGDDQFEPVDVGGMITEEPIGKQAQCREAILEVVCSSPEPLGYSQLWKYTESKGIKRSTFDSTMKRMKEEDEIIKTESGYLSSDPYA